MAQERRVRLDALQSRVAAAQLELEQDPENVGLQGALSLAREHLTSFNAGHAKWVDSIIQARWIEAGDKSSKLFFKQFKGLAAAKDIPELFDADGQLEKSWEGMSQIATGFFSNILGERQAPQNSGPEETFIHRAILIQDRLRPDEKTSVNLPLTLEELGAATSAMANSKCPGPDGVPVEFYKALWHIVGPLVLSCITKDIDEEHFPEHFTRGAIVLLKKKEDQRQLTNKRPITLLNTVYKIGAKAIQRRISPILQRVISHQQSAFLPGRNIHHTLLLMAEMLHQAQISGEDHILLKLDVRKAFDSLEWPFILATIERAGLNGMLSGFLKASFSSASSHIILNGRPTTPFRLARSVRQGCPISPLIFILAFDNLSLMLSEAVAQQTLVGVRFPHLDTANLHTMFADDTSMVIKAEMRYVKKVKEILDIFGAASGLYCTWEKTKAAFIPGGLPPVAFRPLPWQWEVNATATKLLGFPTASSFSSIQMEQLIVTKMSTSIEKLKLRHLSLAGRVTAANCLIMGSLWYILTLWAGDLDFLSKIQKGIEAFVWADKSRVNRNTTTQGKAKGGLGLMLISEQYKALAGNLMLWALGPGDHPLRIILSAHLRELSRRQWGYPDFTWVVSKGGGKLSGGSTVWQNICAAWDSLKPLLVVNEPRNLEEWKLLPLWSPHLAHTNPKLVRCKSLAQHRLREGGLVQIGDITANDGSFLTWIEVPHNNEDSAARKAFDRLVNNLRAVPRFQG